MVDQRRVIVVGVDGSPGATRAIRWAVEEARAQGDGLLLVHAWQFPGLAMSTYAGDHLPIFGHADLEKAASELLDQITATARGSAPGMHIESRLVEGHPAAVLVDAARDARMLVVGSRGLGGFSGMLMGSVSSACAHHAHCPVVVVPPQLKG